MIFFFITASGAQRETSKAKDYVGSHGTNSYAGGGAHRNNLDVEDNRSGPFFDKSASKNITALLGKTAYLSCRVKNLGNKTVSLHFSM